MQKAMISLKLGIMQPYFFPYIGYFSLIQYTDEFIFFDTPQYIAHGWINRNRILKQGGGTNYIIVPIVKAPRNTAIQDIRIYEKHNWREKIFGQLTVYKKKAPYYDQTVTLLHDILDQPYLSLSALNISSIIMICNFLGIKKKFQVFSKMRICIDEVHNADEWALNIAKALHYHVYVNLPGGMEFFDRSKYTTNGIQLEFLKINLKPYIQRIGYFEPSLSIVDVMMFCTKSEIVDMLSEYTIL